MLFMDYKRCSSRENRKDVLSVSFVLLVFITCWHLFLKSIYSLEKSATAW